MILDSENELLEGKFIAEDKSRFLCTVCLDGKEHLCYVPSSCKLGNLIDLKGRTVLLKRNASTKARTEYAIYAVKYGQQYILLNLAQVNKVIAEQIHRRYFSFLGKRNSVQHEKYIEGYRSDLYIQDTNTLIEIKTLLTLEKVAAFPSVYSERSIEQLKKLSLLLDEGYKVCYLVVSLTTKVKEIQLNSEFSDFCELFQECVQKGMMVKLVSLCISDNQIRVHSSGKVVL